MPPKFGPVYPREEGTAADLRQQMRAAIDAGVQPRSSSTNYGQYLPTDRGKIKLQKPDGALTRQGRDYYDMIGLNPPLLYSYEQPLINDKFVLGYDGKKILVRRWDTTLNIGRGGYKVTKKGEDYLR